MQQLVLMWRVMVLGWGNVGASCQATVHPMAVSSTMFCDADGWVGMAITDGHNMAITEMEQGQCAVLPLSLV